MVLFKAPIMILSKRTTSLSFDFEAKGQDSKKDQPKESLMNLFTSVSLPSIMTCI